MDDLIKEDMKFITEKSNVDFERMAGKSILVTGATGLIGSNIVLSLMSANKNLEIPIKIYVYVRNTSKAYDIFGNESNLTVVIGDISEPIVIDNSIDYIIHCANQTSSRAFVHEPVETINTALNGTRNLLEFAREKEVSSFVYLSTMEVYGSPITDDKVTEDHGTDLDTMKVRTCYPESKRMCESLCASYTSEFKVPVKVARLSQTFGPGVSYNDGRVFAEFGRCVLENRNIILHTKGETRRNYLYTADAVTAVLTMLLDGVSGEAYNVTNEDTYCSIYEMATLVAQRCALGKITVDVQEEDEGKYGFAPVLHMNLDSSKLKKLGWTANFDLFSMFDRMIKCMVVR